MKTRGLLLTVLASVFILALSACGKEGEKSRTADATPGVTKDAPSETPSPTATLSPTPSPTPSVPAVVLPEGFPELTVNRDAKFTQRELEEKIYNAAHAAERYGFREVITYAEQQELWETTGAASEKYLYDEVVKMYAAEYDTEYPAAAVYSLNGETVIARYITEYGSMTEIGEKRNYVINYTEKDTAGNVLYAQGDRYFRYCDYNGEGQLLRNAGYLLVSVSEKTGSLVNLAMYTYDEHGNQSSARSYVKKDDAYKTDVDSTFVYEYTEDGNLSRKELTEKQNGVIFSHTSETYVVKKDEKGRAASLEVTDLLNANGSYKDFLFYHEDGSVLTVRIRKDAVDQDGNPAESIIGRLFYPTEKGKESLLKGVYTDEYGDEVKTLRQGEMKRISEGETENCFTWNAENLWQDNTYKNGLLVHEINNTKSGYEYRYEYDQKGRVTRKYGFAGMGDFDFRYTHDANGNLIKEVKKAAYCLSIAMGYYTVGDDDWTDRAMNITETVAYTYDKNGKCTAVERTVTEKGARIGTEKCSFEEDGYPNRREAECLKGGKQVWKLVGERIAQNESKEK